MMSSHTDPTANNASIRAPGSRSKNLRAAMVGLLVLGMLASVLFFLGNPGKAWGTGGDLELGAYTSLSSPPLNAASVYTNCHFGVGQVNRSVLSYDISSLNPGWYLSWSSLSNPPRPGGIEFAQMIHVRDSGYSPTGTLLASQIAANPGALWLIGNEPDCVYQDNVLPQKYAQLYHDAYAFIKSNDPTAQVAVGGIVQPTPLRMQYLDIVLNTYVISYGQSLPADAWAIHSFILREANCSVYRDCWGAGIPPGITATVGISTPLDLDNTDNLSIFQQRVVQFRQWMRNRGYRHIPLLITEYGTLLPYYDPDSLYYDSQGRPFDEERAKVFMYGTFDFMLTAKDTTTGYPSDENRLVQRWIWYSLDDAFYGGALFDYSTLQMQKLGAYFGDYTGSLSPAVDLFAASVGQVGPVPYSPANPVTLTLKARVSNVGNIPLNQPVTVRFVDDQGHQIGADQVISGALAGCAAVKDVAVIWPNVTPGAHVVRAIADPIGAVNEGNENNNEVYGTVWVAKHQIFLPSIARP